MKILSLFDGISCARVALERAGIPVEVYYASEIEKKPIEISLKNYPDIIQLGDVTKITKDMVGEIDLICGGSPCQSFSNAGNRQGFDGKSGLFYEFVRLVKEIKPKYFLLENVKMKQEWQDVISEELGVKPIEINSNLVSGQNRKRLYWTNIPNVTQPEDKGIYLQDILQDEVDDRYYLSESNIKTINRNFGSKGKIINLKEDSLIEKITYPSRINQKLGKIKSPTLVAAMGMGGGNVPVIVKAVALRNRGYGKLPEVGGDKANCITSVKTDSMVIKIDTKVKVRKYPVDILKLKTILKENKILTNKEIADNLKQPLTLVEHWFRNDTSFSIPSENIWFELKKLLNIQTNEFDKSITEFEIKDGKFDMAKRVYPETGKSPTLTTGNEYKILTKQNIRKLTEIECERLQTLPDNYTSDVASTHRYKAIGNGWTVDVIAHILSFIK